LALQIEYLREEDEDEGTLEECHLDVGSKYFTNSHFSTSLRPNKCFRSAEAAIARK
jgi:hypothetical protein